MEIAIRQQISDSKKKEQLLYGREDELRKMQLEQLTDFEEQKKTLEEERRYLESVRDEVDQRMHRSATSQGSRVAPNLGKAGANQKIERKNSNCDMPRQMPSEIDRQIRQDTEIKQLQRNRLDIPNFDSVVEQSTRQPQQQQQSHSRQASLGSMIHQVRSGSCRGDLSIDQANKLDMALQDQHSLAEFGIENSD